MEKYEFKVRKIVTNTVELKAENYKEALIELLELFATADKEIFQMSKDKVVHYDIILREIKDKNDMKYLKNVKDFLQKLEQNMDDFNPKVSLEIEKKEDNFDTKYKENMCKKCGNCVRLDEDFMS